jgi:hypothetical protein
MMTDTSTGQPGSDQPHDERGSDREVIQRASRSLDVWRAKIDQLMVQLDLANLDAREEIRASIDAAQNAYLAARSRLAEVGHDSGAGLTALRQGIEKVLGDLREAYESAEAAIRRSSAR